MHGTAVGVCEANASLRCEFALLPRSVQGSTSSYAYTVPKLADQTQRLFLHKQMGGLCSVARHGAPGQGGTYSPAGTETKSPPYAACSFTNAAASEKISVRWSCGMLPIP